MLLIGSVAVAKAQTDYEFAINGVEITSNNVGNMGTIPGVTIGEGGHLTYNKETRTLSMKNVSLEIGKEEGRCLGVSKGALFTLHLEGENSFKAPNSYGIICYETCITGPGELSIEVIASGIYVCEGTLTVANGCTVNVLSESSEIGHAGVEGHWESPTHLIIKDATLHVKAKGQPVAPYPYAVGGFQSIRLEGVQILEPSEATIGNYTHMDRGDTYTHAFVLLNGKPATEVKIAKDVAVEEVEATALKLYPNPANRYIRIEGAKADTPIALYTLEGVRLLTAEANEAGFAEFDLTDLPAGNYVVKAGNGQGYRLLIRR
ncbi:hypothetical protein HQ36_01585 [Porphyromonas gingivicanis]|uniref:Secretion system C-terminal sorting domain-containing protein n=1 Tax=Porphyromonas gingivicanis TaxID=266762 RepID=A0A0A2G7C9_9PORP|nr:hypothetical protein HQ36_01585 [Porphyromonas gingivicanis]